MQIFSWTRGIANDSVPYHVENILVACVYNATYYDRISENKPEIPKLGRTYWYQSNRDSLRLKWSNLPMQSWSLMTKTNTKRFLDLVAHFLMLPATT